MFSDSRLEALHTTCGTPFMTHCKCECNTPHNLERMKADQGVHRPVYTEGASGTPEELHNAAVTEQLAGKSKVKGKQEVPNQQPQAASHWAQVICFIDCGNAPLVPTPHWKHAGVGLPCHSQKPTGSSPLGHHSTGIILPFYVLQQDCPSQ
jgi:hypothetical protein